MVTDTMRKDAVPAGHNEKGPLPRMATTESRCRTFVEDWLNWCKDTNPNDKDLRWVHFGQQMFDKEYASFSLPELEAAIMLLAEHPAIAKAGLLLSGAYEREQALELTFSLQLPVPLDYVGYGLPKGKSLHVTQPVGKYCYRDGRGFLVLDAPVGGLFAQDASCVISRTNLEYFDGPHCIIHCGTTPAMQTRVPGFLMDYGPAHELVVDPCGLAVVAWKTMSSQGRVIVRNDSRAVIASSQVKDTVSPCLSCRGKFLHYDLYQQNLPLKQLVDKIGIAAVAPIEECVAFFRTLGPCPGHAIENLLHEIVRREDYV